MTSLGQTTAPRRRGVRILFAAAVLLAVIGLVGWAVPWLVRGAAEQWLADHGAPAATIADLRWNPLAGTLALDGLATGGAVGERLELDHLAVNLAMTALLEGRIQLQAVTLAGLDMDLLLAADGGLQVGPVTLPGVAAGPEQAAEPAAEPWGFGLDAVHLNDIKVRARRDELAGELVLGQLTLGALASWQADQQTPLTLSAELFGAPVAVTGNVRPLADAPGAAVDLAVGPLDLAQLQPLLDALVQDNFALQGRLATEQQLQVHLSDGQLALAMDGWLTLDDLAAVVPQGRLAQEHLRWQGELALADGTPRVHGDITGGGVAVGLPTMAAAVLQVADWQVAGLAVQGPNDLQVAQLVVSDLLAVPQGDARPPLLRLASATLSSLRLQEQTQLDLAALELQGLALDLQRTAAGDILLPDAVQALLAADVEPGAAELAVAAPAPAPAGSGLPLRLRLGRLGLAGDSSIRVQDASVTPTFATVLAPVSLSLTGLDTGMPEQPLQLALEARQSDFTSLQVSGTLTPLAAAPAVDLAIKLSGLDLPQLSPYVPGYDLQTGRLTLDSKVQIKGDALTVDNALVLERLLLAGKAGEGIPGFAQGLAMPLETALDLLRDGDGRIALQVPVRGSLSDPQVGTADIIRRATQGALQKAAMSYVTNALQPLGTILFVAELAGEAAKPRFAPVTFAPNSAQLSAEQQAYLEKLGQLLTARPALTVTVCGLATPADQPPPVDSSEPPPEPDPAEQLRWQLDQAEARALAVRRALVADQGVAQERLFACQAKLDSSAGAEPRVALKL